MLERLVLRFAVAALGPCCVLAAQSAPLDLDAADRLLREHLAQRGVGLAAAIVHDGRVVLNRSYGHRSLGGDAVEADTRFAIGSVTKQMTCACILLLAEDGKLTVDDKVASHYPELSRAHEITLLDLMNHTSGYPDYYPLDYVDERMTQPIEPDELLRRYAGAALDFEPGTSWSYSNTGYILLGRVVERVSGEPFGAFLRRRVLMPLGMDATLYEPSPQDELLARGHASFALGPPEPSRGEARGWIGAAGGVWTTAADLAKWDLALLDGKLLAPRSLALMTARRRLRDGRLTSYGCGFALRTQAGREVWAHNGAVDGFAASNAVIPSTRSAVIVLANHAGGLGTLPDRLLALVTQEAPSAPAVRGPAAAEALRAAFAELQRGTVERARYTVDFNAFLTDARIAAAKVRLAPFGAPTRIEVLRTRERGGMEVTVSRLAFAKTSLQALMYRQSDGAIAQLFVSAE